MISLSKIDHIFHQFSDEKIVLAEPISGGHIQSTLKIHTECNNRYILQKINPMYGTGSTENAFWVTSFLKRRRIPTLNIIPAPDHRPYTSFEDEIWRCTSYIEGSNYPEVKSAHIAYRAGAGLAQFLVAMTDFPDFIQKCAVDFRAQDPIHASQYHYKKCTEITENEKNSGIKKLSTEILANLERSFLPSNLRTLFTHGDPKIQNFMFGSENQPGTMIDLDDVGNQLNPLYDIGDGFRSWCCQPTGPDNAFFNLEKFYEGWKGFMSKAPALLMDEEYLLVPQAIRLISLELASRFLRDYYQDYYFSWSPELYASRKDHNLARAQRFYKLSESVWNQKDDIDQIIERSRRS